MPKPSETKHYSSTYQKFLPIALLVAGALAMLLFIFTTSSLLKMPSSPYQALYVKLAEKSTLHQQTLSIYAQCRGLKGTWANKMDVIAHDCLTTTMRQMDKLNLPRADLFGIEQDIRKGEWEISERIINTP